MLVYARLASLATGLPLIGTTTLFDAMVQGCHNYGDSSLTMMAILRKSIPAGIEISAGGHGSNLDYFRRMLDAEAVDVLQADTTHCLISVFRKDAEKFLD